MNQKKIKTDAGKKFRDALIATMQAIAGKQTLPVTLFEKSEAPEETKLCPQLAPQMTEAKMAIARGYADSLALKWAYHDPELHLSLRPRTQRAAQLFNDLEQVRVETLGTLIMPGIIRNLSAMMEQEFNTEQNKNKKNKDPLLYVLPFFFHQKLTGMPLPKQAHKLMSEWQGWLEKKIGKKLNNLTPVRLNQRIFANALLELISDLELDDDDDDDDEKNTDLNSDEKKQKELENKEKKSSQKQDERKGVEKNQNCDRDDHIKSIDMPVEQKDEESGTSRFATPAFNSGQENGKGDAYKTYTQEFDNVFHAHDLCSVKELQQLRNDLNQQAQHSQGLVTRLANKLQRRLTAQKQQSWSFDLEEGILDVSRLARIIIDPTSPLSFKREKQSDFRDTIVTLLLDNSGSMRGRPITITAICADILARTLERCGIRIEILGFTTSTWKGGLSKEKWLRDGCPENPGRLNDLCHIIYKEADALWRHTKCNLGLMMKDNLLKENIDGEALKWAHQRLIRYKEQRKVLMVISDGMPIDDSTLAHNAPHYLEQHLRQVIEEIETRSPVELIAIGIGHDVTPYYRRAVSVSNVEDLGSAMMEKLSNLFQKNKRDHKTCSRFTEKRDLKKFTNVKKAFPTASHQKQGLSGK
ncbi:MAG: cobaltochelatase subunit CobT [Alphaproteobacteria bacterium]|nr:cobaltochelatase subunit CobT [Alphaproteobacteria bacterium]